MHEYDHHIGDYTRDTVGLSMAEDGCYRRMLDQYYARELPLPCDREEVYRLARASGRPERKIVDYILDRYFDLREDGWHNHRADRELAELHGRSDKARIAAEERWRRQREREARKTGRRATDNDANVMQSHMQPHMQMQSERNASAYANASPEHAPSIEKPMLERCPDDAQAMHLGARARVPPSGLPVCRLPFADLPNRGSVVSQPSEARSGAPPHETAQPAVENITTPKINGKSDGAGQQWKHPAYVEATAKTLGLARRENEDDVAFKDRVYTEVQQRIETSRAHR